MCSHGWVASSSGTVDRVKLLGSLNSLAFSNVLGDGTCEANKRETAVTRYEYQDRKGIPSRLPGESVESGWKVSRRVYPRSVCAHRLRDAI
jgi:hypothetical protein